MTLFLLLAALLASPASAAPAPDFSIAQVQNAPLSRIGGPADLKGKVVFVEFWATWCGPCVAGIPRTNRLVNALKGEPVVFLAVTDEPGEMIEAFRKTHEMKAWVGIDREKSSLKAFHVRGRPAGFLIGKDGTLLASIFPDSLKEQDLRDAIAGRFAPRPFEWADAPPPAKKGAPAGKTYFEARVAEASGKPGMDFRDESVEAHALPFASAVAWIWDVFDSQVVADVHPVPAFDFYFRVPDGDFDRGRSALKNAVETSFGVRVVPERRETDVLALSLSKDAGAPRPRPAAPGGKTGLMSFGGGRLLAKAPMPEIARALWTNLDVPVVDETGLKGDYDFDLEWKRGDRSELDRLLAQKGLVLVPARRAVDFVRVVAAARR